MQVRALLYFGLNKNLSQYKIKIRSELHGLTNKLAFCFHWVKMSDR